MKQRRVRGRRRPPSPPSSRIFAAAPQTELAGSTHRKLFPAGRLGSARPLCTPLGLCDQSPRRRPGARLRTGFRHQTSAAGAGFGPRPGTGSGLRASVLGRSAGSPPQRSPPSPFKPSLTRPALRPGESGPRMFAASDPPRKRIHLSSFSRRCDAGIRFLARPRQTHRLPDSTRRQ